MGYLLFLSLGLLGWLLKRSADDRERLARLESLYKEQLAALSSISSVESLHRAFSDQQQELARLRGMSLELLRAQTAVRGRLTELIESGALPQLPPARPPALAAAESPGSPLTLQDALDESPGFPPELAAAPPPQPPPPQPPPLVELPPPLVELPPPPVELPRAAAVAPAAPAGASDQSAPPVSPASFDWETLLGVRGAAWLGAVALVIAGTLFAKYSIENELIRPPLRIAFLIALALSALASSEFFLRPRYATTANALCGGGVAILYAALFAAHNLYDLWGLAPTFALMALTTVTAALLALRYQNMYIAVLGMLGGFATPLALATGQDRPYGLFAYILLLDLGFLFLAVRRGWHRLALLNLLGTLLMEAGWAGRFLSPAKMPIGVGVALVFAFLFLGLPIYMRGLADKQRRELLYGSAVAGLLPFGFAWVLAAHPQYARNWPLLFGFAACLELGLLWVAVQRWPVLALLGFLATAATHALWDLTSLEPPLMPVGVGAALLLAAPFWVVPQVWRKLGGAAPTAVAPGPLRLGAALAAVAPLVLCCWLAGQPAYGARWALLFGALGVANAAILWLGVRQGRLLIRAGLGLTIACHALWIGASMGHEQLPLVMGLVLLFGLPYLVLLTGPAAPEDPVEGTADATLAAAAPFALSFYLASAPEHAEKWALLFGFVAILDGVVLALAAWRRRAALLLVVAAATSFTQVAWAATALGEATLWGGTLSSLALGAALGAVPRLWLGRLGRGAAAAQLPQWAGLATLLGLLLFMGQLLQRGLGEPPAAFLLLVALATALLLERTRLGAIAWTAPLGGLLLAGLVQAWILGGLARAGGDAAALEAAVLLRDLAVPVLLAAVLSGAAAWRTSRWRAQASAQPSSAQPPSAQPSTAQPPTAQPPTAQPPTAQPPSAQPPSAQPPSAQPSTAQPLTAQPSTAQPLTAQPSTAQPPSAQAEVSRAGWAELARDSELGALAAMLTGLVGLLLSVGSRSVASQPELLFPALLLLAGLVLATVARQSWTWLALLALALTAAVALNWQQVELPPTLAALGWLGTAYLFFLAVPLLMLHRLPALRAHRSLFFTVALAGPLFFLPLYQAFVATLGRGAIGLLPVVLAALGGAALAIVQALPRPVPTAQLPAALLDRRALGHRALLATVALAFVALAIALQLQRQWIAVGWAVLAATVWWLYRRLPHPGLKYFGLLLYAAVAVRLVPTTEVLHYEPRGLVLLNWLLYSYGIPCLSFLVGAAGLRAVESRYRSESEQTFAIGSERVPLHAVVSFAGLLLLFVLLNLEIADAFSPGPYTELWLTRSYARDLTRSVAWGVYALVLLIVGMRRDRKGLRYFSLGAMLLTIAKVFLYDLANVGGIYRSLSFLGLAVSLILVSLLYQRFVFQSAARRRPLPPAP